MNLRSVAVKLLTFVAARGSRLVARDSRIQGFEDSGIRRLGIRDQGLVIRDSVTTSAVPTPWTRRRRAATSLR